MGSICGQQNGLKTAPLIPGGCDQWHKVKWEENHWGCVPGLCPVLGSPSARVTQIYWSFIYCDPAQGHKDDYWIGASLISGDTETAGSVQPGEKKAQGNLINVYKQPMAENEDEGLDCADRSRATGHKLKHIKYLLWGTLDQVAWWWSGDNSNLTGHSCEQTSLDNPAWAVLDWISSLDWISKAASSLSHSIFFEGKQYPKYSIAHY